MANEEVVSIIFQAENRQLISALTQGANRVNAFNQLVGQSDAVLRRAETAQQVLATTAREAAARLKEQGEIVRGLSAEIARLRERQTQNNQQLQQQKDRAAALSKQLTTLQNSTRTLYEAFLRSNQALRDAGLEEIKLDAAARRAIQSATQASEARRKVRTATQESAAATNTAATASDNLTRSMQAQNVQSLEANTRLTALRYALYDIAGGFNAVQQGSRDFLGRTLTDFKTFELGWLQVVRTTQDIPELRFAGPSVQSYRDLIQISRELPETFEDIAKIATLGGQLGLKGSAAIDEFTRVVIELTTTTDLSAESAGTMLGRFQSLLGLDPSNFRNLASAVLNVGVNSAATESQIAGVSTQISSMSRFAGLGTPDVIGFAGALASVAVPKELSRSIATRLFTQMSNAARTGGEDLAGFAHIARVSAEDFQSAWGTEAFGDILPQFFVGLRAAKDEGEDVVGMLNDLGISSVRDIPVLLRLADASDVVVKSFADAREGYADISILQTQYNLVAQATSNRLVVLTNGIQEFFAEIGRGQSGPIHDFVNTLIEIVHWVNDFVQTPLGRTLTGWSIAIGVLALVFSALGSVFLRIAGGALAFRLVMEQLTNVGFRQGEGVVALTAQIRALLFGRRADAAATEAQTAASLRHTAALKAEAAATASNTTATATGTGTRAASGGLAAVGRGALRIGGAALIVDLVSQFMGTVFQEAAGDPSLSNAIRRTAGDWKNGISSTDAGANNVGRYIEGIPVIGGWINNLLGGSSGIGGINDWNMLDEQIVQLAQQSLPAAYNQFMGLMRAYQSAGGSLQDFHLNLNESSDIFSNLSKAQIDNIGAAKGVQKQWGLTDEAVSALNADTVEFASSLGQVNQGLNAVVEGIGYNGLDDFYESMTKLGEMIGQVVSFSDIIGGIQAESEELARQTAEDLTGSAEDWKNYYNGVDFTLDEFTKRLEEQVAAQATYGENLATIIGRGGRQIVDYMSDLDVDDAQLLAAKIAAASDEEFARIVTAAQTAAAQTQAAWIAQLIIDPAVQQNAILGFTNIGVQSAASFVSGVSDALSKSNISPDQLVTTLDELATAAQNVALIRGPEIGQNFMDEILAGLAVYPDNADGVLANALDALKLPEGLGQVTSDQIVGNLVNALVTGASDPAVQQRINDALNINLTPEFTGEQLYNTIKTGVDDFLARTGSAGMGALIHLTFGTPMVNLNGTQVEYGNVWDPISAEIEAQSLLAPTQLTTEFSSEQIQLAIDNASANLSVRVRATPIFSFDTLSLYGPFAANGGLAKNGQILPGFANGGGYGLFRGPGTGTSDDILARVSNGEYINTAATVRYYGAQLFDALNRRQIPRMATGGGVGSFPTSMVTSWGPEERNLVRGLAGGQQVVVVLDDEAIARAADRGHAKMVASGTR